MPTIIDALVVSLSLDPKGFEQGSAVADAATKKLQDGAVAAAEAAHKAAEVAAEAARTAAKAQRDYAAAADGAAKDVAKQQMDMARANATSAALEASQKKKAAQDAAGLLAKQVKDAQDAAKAIDDVRKQSARDHQTASDVASAVARRQQDAQSAAAAPATVQQARRAVQAAAAEIPGLQQEFLSASGIASRAADESVSAAQRAAEATEAYAKASGDAAKEAAHIKMDAALAESGAAAKSAAVTGKAADEAGEALAKKRAEQADNQKKIREEDSRTSKAIQESGKKAAETYTKVRNEVAALFATFVGARGLEQFVSQTNDADTATAKLSRALGVSAEDLSALGVAAAQAGGSSEGAQSSLSSVVLNLQKFKMGLGGPEVTGAIQQLEGVNGGVSIFRDAVGNLRTPFDQFKAILLDLQKLKEQQGGPKAEIFGQVLGLDQSTIDLALRSGSQLSALIEQARQYSANTADTAAAEARVTEFSKLQSEAQDAGRKILTDVTPALIEFMQGIESLVTEFEQWAETDDHLNNMIKGLNDWVMSIDWATVKADIVEAGTATSQFFDDVIAAARKLGLIDAKTYAEAKADADRIAANPNATPEQKAAAAKDAEQARRSEIVKGSSFWQKVEGSFGLGPLGSEAGYQSARQADALSEAAARNRQLSDTPDRFTEITTTGPSAAPAAARAQQPSAAPASAATAVAQPPPRAPAVSAPVAPIPVAISGEVPTIQRDQTSWLARIAGFLADILAVLRGEQGALPGSDRVVAPIAAATAPRVASATEAPDTTRFTGAAESPHSRTLPEDMRRATATGMSVLQKEGLSKNAAAGIVGWMSEESNLNPVAYNPNDAGSPSMGIGQWHAGRLKNLLDFFKAKGIDAPSATELKGRITPERRSQLLKAEFEFLASELKTTEAKNLRGVERAATTGGPSAAARAAVSLIGRPAKWAEQNAWHVASGFAEGAANDALETTPTAIAAQESKLRQQETANQLAAYAKMRDGLARTADALVQFGPRIIHPAIAETAKIAATATNIVHHIANQNTTDNSVRSETHVHGPINVQTQATDAKGVAGGIGAHLQQYNDMAAGANTAVA